MKIIEFTFMDGSTQAFVGYYSEDEDTFYVTRGLDRVYIPRASVRYFTIAKEAPAPAFTEL